MNTFLYIIVVFVISVIAIPVFFICLIVFSSFIGIFLPLKYIYSKDHFDRCWLRHATMNDRWWHFLDTRANLNTIDDLHEVFKGSPNRLEWCRREKKSFEQDINENVFGADYQEYCKKELEKIDKEMAGLLTNK